MDTISTLGKIIPDHQEPGRDAIHIAVMPVVAGEDLHPGQKLRMAFGTTNMVLSGTYNDDYVGRADPFLEAFTIEKGKKFWMYLRPGTITGLRHEWTHPTIDKVPPVDTSAAEKWLREFADKWNFDYNEMIAGALEEDGYVTAMGRDLHSASELDAGDEETFWQNIAAITGKSFSDKHKANFSWSCSC